MVEQIIAKYPAGVSIKVDINFKNRIRKFIEDYHKKYHIYIDCVEATRILNEKIEKQGGLVVS